MYCSIFVVLNLKLPLSIPNIHHIPYVNTSFFLVLALRYLVLPASNTKLWKTITDALIADSESINPLSANPTKWSNTLKIIVSCCQLIVWVCLTILWGWYVKGKAQSVHWCCPFISSHKHVFLLSGLFLKECVGNFKQPQTCIFAFKVILKGMRRKLVDY